MVTKDLVKRNEKSHDLRVLKSNGNYFVESAEGMVLYKVNPTGEPDKFVCTCGDYNRGIKSDPNFSCKHVMAVQSCVMTEQADFLEKKSPKLDERFIIEIDGKQFVTYAGLLQLAHLRHLSKMHVEAVQLPSKENGFTAICKAIAQTATGFEAQDYGDASTANCSSRVNKHLLRMASTRAKARCLRDLTNVGMTCLEELADLREVLDEELSKRDISKKTLSKKNAIPVESKDPKQTKSEEGNGRNGGNGSNDKNKAADSKLDETKTAPKPELKPAPKVESKPEPAPKLSSAQKSALMNLSRRRGISVQELENMAQQNYGVPLDNLSSANASSFIRQLQQSA